MKVKMFIRKSGWSGVLPLESVEEEVNRWLAFHPTIKVIEVKHDFSSSVWSWPTFLVSVYYDEGSG
jgi:hypothetical protein